MLLLLVQLLQSAVLFVKTLCLVLFSPIVPIECFNPVSYSVLPLSPFALVPCYLRSLWFSVHFQVSGDSELVTLTAVAVTGP